MTTVAVLLASAFATLVAPGASPASRRPSPPVDLSAADRCDFIGQQQGSRCLLPFPDDYYTVRDRRTATGRRVNLQTAAMPANVRGVHIDAAPLQPKRRLQPRLDDRRQGSRARQRGRPVP